MSSKQIGHVVLIIRLIFSKNVDESDKFSVDFFAKLLIGFVSTNVILNGKCIGGLIWAVHRQKNTLVQSVHYTVTLLDYSLFFFLVKQI